MFDLEPHDFSYVNGRWYCDHEGVDADECTDYERCNYQCVCNDKEDNYGSL